MLFETISAQTKLTFTLEPGLAERRAKIGRENISLRGPLETLAAVKKLRIRETGRIEYSVAAAAPN